MAAAGNEPQYIPIMSEDEFTKQNNEIKKLYDVLREYKDGKESISYLPFRLYDSYDAYVNEQEERNEIIKMKTLF